MKRGGYRPGAGRPKGSKGRKNIQVASVAGGVPAAIPSGMTPLEHMLMVMRDVNADPLRRDRMAIAAAPFCHPRMYDNRFGKKDAAAEAANTLVPQSKWDADLDFEIRPN